jgi:hypothetical protein
MILFHEQVTALSGFYSSKIMLMKFRLYAPALTLIALFSQCTSKPDHVSVYSPDSTGTAAKEAPRRADISYKLVYGKDSLKALRAALPDGTSRVLQAVNRVDAANLTKLDTLLVPEDVGQELPQYSPFPFRVAALSDVNKIILFSYPAQYFAAYEHGRLVYTGQTNMGRAKDPTPTGLFFCNWKAEKTTSTFNDEWELKWNFNIQNKEGVGFHQYALPGYPASHSCLRLTEADARYLYDWAEQWKIKGTDEVLANGTPVIVFGSYPFGASKPWLQLAGDKHALDIKESDLGELIKPYKDKIAAAQQQTAAMQTAAL